MKIIDLSHTLQNNMPVFPGMTQPQFTEKFTVEKDGYKETEIKMLSHTGTHIDCPAHMLNSSITTDTVDLSSFYGSAFVADFSHKNNAEQITIEDISIYEKQLIEKNIILIYTNWDKQWGFPSYLESFPYLSTQAVEFIVKCGIRAIGLDVISLDAIDSVDYENHHIALSNNLVIIENLCHVDLLINQNFIFSAFPLKIIDGDGSPVRAVAILD
jgi:kynurenine formamidase